MRFYLTFSVLLLTLVGWQEARGQCLPLASFQALGVEASGAIVPPPIVNQVLATTQWQFVGPVGNTKELAWTSIGAETGELPAFRLSLRPVQQRYDVVLKTVVNSCFKQLRQELSARKLKPEPITCPDCEGQRYTLPEGSTVSFYSNMKGDYPLIIVMHPAPAPTASTIPGRTP